MKGVVALSQAQEAEVRRAIAEQSAADAAALHASLESNGGNAAPPGPPLPQDVGGLVAELSALTGAVQYAHSLQVREAFPAHVLFISGFLPVAKICTFHVPLAARRANGSLRRSHFSGLSAAGFEGHG